MNILTPFKKFFQNKNTVTIVCIILGVLTLVIGYNYRVSKAVDFVTIPFAKKEIPKKTQITKDMIGHVKVPRALITNAKNIITSDKDLIDKYSSYSTNIPAKSLFYKDVVLKVEQMPDYAFMNMQDGYTVYSLKVNSDSTFSNHIFPNEYIDLYVLIKDGDKIINEPLITHIKVKAVKDSGGRSLLENTLSGGSPSALLFEVEDKWFRILKKSEYVNGVTIYPVKRNSNYSRPEGSTVMSSEEIINYINRNTKDA